MRRDLAVRIKRAYILPLVAAIVPFAGWPQQQHVANVVTKTSRPLVELAQALVLKEGWLVDYEDPAYTFPGDLVDVTKTQTSAAFRAANPGKQVLGVRSNSVAFSFPFRTVSPELDNPVALISALLAVNEQAGNPGIFKVISSGRHLQIVPDQIKNAAGIMTPQMNPLDRPLNFPDAVRSGSEIVYLIRDQLRSGGVNTGIGTIPTNYLNQTEMSIGATGEPARAVLLRMIGGLHWRETRIQVPTTQLV